MESTRLDQVYFHNVAELEERAFLPGLRLQRFPKEVREALTAKGRTAAVESSGCELRFVTEAKVFRLTLAAQEKDGQVLVFKGDLFHAAYTLKAGVFTTLELEQPDRFAEVPEALLTSGAFSPQVWRVYFERYSAVVADIDTFGYGLRPPRQEEMPSLTMLAYGSSITHGVGAISHYNCYAQQTGRRLGVDVLNMGLSGSCFCEPEVARHFAVREDWDFAYLELGVNMRAVVPVEEFERRVNLMLDGLIERHPTKPIFLTTIYPNRATHFFDTSHPYAVAELAFNDVLKRYRETKRHENLFLLDGREIMTDFTSLTTDLIHPSEYGHMRMGEQLASLLGATVSKLRLMKRRS
ncbi:SGNH/GDSL hydrolase family protein [Paenibacillus whitsoniae]|uniref:Lipase n=1 Tax=Paenibacillus whitsoniae TaxID=2496558 RepID=A0A3S0IDN5_9BACL|nr:SGNH/GDSL hydrolase family protein [Paenibacillus whitsoniae]RTE10633.1 lipase [Paenibacillus whitsoniae]